MLIDRVYMPAEIAVNSTVEKIQKFYLLKQLFWLVPPTGACDVVLFSSAAGGKVPGLGGCLIWVRKVNVMPERD